MLGDGHVVRNASDDELLSGSDVVGNGAGDGGSAASEGHDDFPSSQTHDSDDTLPDDPVDLELASPQ